MSELPSRTDLEVRRLGAPGLRTPLRNADLLVDEDDRVVLTSSTRKLQAFLDRGARPPSFERAGAREHLYFDPATIGVGVVSCGGLCPGINNVIRSLVLTLVHHYRVPRILGFRWGYAGLAGPGCEKEPPIELTTQLVSSIHALGGSVLGTSRGPQDVKAMVDRLEQLEISILFAIGGDGTLRGASALAAEVSRRGKDIAVIGVPKTIDNDIRWIERSFGFATAVEEARQAIVGAHAEARGAWNAIGLVKLMGRHSGFITAHASLANSDVNFCLVPEVPFTLDGRGGLLEVLELRLRERHHAVIAVAEGAGQDLIRAEVDEHARVPSGPRSGSDASGNVKLEDIGPFLKRRIGERLKDQGVEHTIKYIDPSYIVRSMPANSLDAAFCLQLGQHAVHAGMAGRTDMVVGYWNRRFTHVPIPVAVARRNTIDPDGPTWQRVLEATGQPSSMVGS
ncbi:MAG: ATP-dependent 6-phosphofructokinase [Thermoanaerobaculia bacterium]|nr:ATP-dependent 6-phosphofructokinase [Thermoanaerobaculia bacterium]